MAVNGENSPNFQHDHVQKRREVLYFAWNNALSSLPNIFSSVDETPAVNQANALSVQKTAMDNNPDSNHGTPQHIAALETYAKDIIDEANAQPEATIHQIRPAVQEDINRRAA